MEDKLLTPEQLCEIIPGTSKQYWATLRFKGQGPKFIKPSPRTVLYRLSTVMSWLDAREFQGNAEVIN